MKRLIFSIFTDNLKSNISVNEYKIKQFKKYKDEIYNAQEEYAEKCGADYRLFNTEEDNYDNIQFLKILKLEELLQDYDEVLYLDFDVIPCTELNFFEEFNLDKISVYNMIRHIDDLGEENTMHGWIKDKAFGQQDIYVKTCCKNAMNSLIDLNVSDYLINTGVIGANKKSIQELDFKNSLKELDIIYKESVIDNLYPGEISSVWIRNNEVYLSHLIESKNIVTQERVDESHVLIFALPRIQEKFLQHFKFNIS
jgi:lipopolysaccharide biosynthesis glycosyltransferase